MSVLHWILRHPVFVALVVGFILVNVLFFFVSPTALVERIGVENAYLVVFGMAALGGLSTFTGVSLYAALLTFAAGGANPLVLGLAAGIGIFASDTVFFLLATYGRRAVPVAWEGAVQRLRRLVRRISFRWTAILSYLYLGFTPLPNDVLMLALVAGEYRYRRIAPVLLAGDLTIALVGAHLGAWFGPW